MKEMTWKSRLNRLFAHRFALPVLCWCAALVFWLVQGAVAFAGDSSAKAKGTLTETSIPIESWQLAELTWGEPGENSAPQGQLITTGGDPQMILEDVSGQVVRTGYNRLRGYYIIIRHEGSVQTLYQHLSYIFVRGGETVTQGQTVAVVGSTGLVTGPHLHLDVQVNGEYVDPLEALG